jgi:hypothetical protein
LLSTTCTQKNEERIERKKARGREEETWKVKKENFFEQEGLKEEKGRGERDTCSRGFDSQEEELS